MSPREPKSLIYSPKTETARAGPRHWISKAASARCQYLWSAIPPSIVSGLDVPKFKVS